MTVFDVVEAGATSLAAAGKAVMCEKPLAPSLSDARRCIDVLSPRAAGVFIAFNRRFRSRALGVAEGDCCRRDRRARADYDYQPRSESPPLDYIPKSGGLFRDMMIHDFDMARWLLGEEAVTLYSRGSCLVDSEIGSLGDIDTACVVMTTSSGKQAVILNSRRATYGYDQRIEAFGSAGMVISDNPRGHRPQTILRQSFRGAGPHSDVLHGSLRRQLSHRDWSLSSERGR
ncbi:MAG TPA: Gfo/Idh/MocA family oxidoreductase, partial [Terrimicrobiaceae bacterium]|nr:Gfo/Idh/MocA family oxidoreductase [Terrimicrobiaceae bacterium]